MLTNLRDTYRSVKVIKYSTIPYIRYSFLLCKCAIVTLSLRRAVFTIFDFKTCCDLEIGVRGHSLKVWVKVQLYSGTIRYIVYGFLLAFFSNFIPKTHRISDIRLQKCRDLEN